MTETPEPTESRKPSRLLLLGVAVALIGWMSGLAVLTQIESPVVVNQRQIRRADTLISGTLADLATKQVRIKEVLHGEKPKADSIEVLNLDLVRIDSSSTYVIPLWRDGRIVKVSNGNPGSGGPVIYPDTEDVRGQILDALERGVIDE